ncbi:MAG: hypothetical protein AAI946_00090 [Candidatus Hodgkinia cicadicola]
MIIDGICYAVKLLKLDRLLLCIQHGVLMLGTESVLSKPVALKLRSLRKVMVSLYSKFALWLTRVSGFDYVCYLKTKLISLSLSSASRALRVLYSALFLYSVCADLKFLVSDVFCKRYHNTFCCLSVQFVRKMMWRVGLSKLCALKLTGASCLVALFGVCMFVLNVGIDKRLAKCDPLKVGSSLQFIAEACAKLGLNIRKLLFSIRSLSTFKPNLAHALSSNWARAKLWTLNSVDALRKLGERKLSALRVAFIGATKRVNNMLSGYPNARRVLSDALGIWRLLVARLLESLQALERLTDAKLLFEWCNLVLMCCCNVFYCITFYRVLVYNERMSFVSAALNVLNSLRAWLMSALLARYKRA